MIATFRRKNKKKHPSETINLSLNSQFTFNVLNSHHRDVNQAILVNFQPKAYKSWKKNSLDKIATRDQSRFM